MFKKRFIKKTMKRLVSLLLVLTVMIGLFVPFDLSVFAEEEAATGNSIYAMLYKYVNNQYELVIQNGNDVDPNKELVKSYSGFADTVNTQKESWIAPWKDERKGIKRVTIRDKIAPKSIDGWFYEMTQLKSSELLHLENLDTSSCEYMRYTFSKSGLEKLDLRSFDVSKVKSAYATFFVCSSLTDLNISNWTLSNVGSDGSGNMESFLQATGLETIDLSSLNLQRCLNLRSMLKGNTKLKNIIFGEVFTVGELTEQTNPQVSLYQMFEGCTALETLDLSSWNVYYCQDCTSVVFNWKTNPWGPKPADADEYFYVIWQIVSNSATTSSQKYRFYWTEDTGHDGSIVYSDYPTAQNPYPSSLEWIPNTKNGYGQYTRQDTDDDHRDRSGQRKGYGI